MRILLDIETCPAWIVPGQQVIPASFLAEAERKRRSAAPARWRDLDQRRQAGAELTLEQQRELSDLSEVAEKMALGEVGDDSERPRLGCDPLRSRVVAVGMQVWGQPETRKLWTAFNPDTEKDLLQSLEGYLEERRYPPAVGNPEIVRGSYGTEILGWRVRDFDVPFLEMRRLIHGLPLGIPDTVIALETMVPCLRSFTGKREVPRLRDLCEALGMAPCGDGTGGDVAQLVWSGQTDKVLEHLDADLDRLDFLCGRLGVKP